MRALKHRTNSEVVLSVDEAERLVEYDPGTVSLLESLLLRLTKGKVRGSAKGQKKEGK